MAEGYTVQRTRRYTNRPRTLRQTPQPETRVCRYFLRGNCMYGSRCRFRHGLERELFGGRFVPEEWLHISTQVDTNDDIIANPSQQEDHTPTTTLTEPTQDNWADAPEFIPSSDHINDTPQSYVEDLHNEGACSSGTDAGAEAAPFEIPLCPLMEKNLECKFGHNCMYIHGDLCELCGRRSLHPTDTQQRDQHHAACLLQSERKVEVSKAISLSQDKSCGICFELIMEKTSREQRFGILPNCIHCFCLSCIRKWRQAKQFENKIIRACPECRVTSDFVCPSMFWVHTKEEKEALIKDYKDALGEKNCKYFNSGAGKCPFGNKCFYRHAYPDGTKADVGPPIRQRRQTAEADFAVLQHIILWDFDENESLWSFNNIEDWDDFYGILSDGSEDSDWSEFDILLE